MRIGLRYEIEGNHLCCFTRRIPPGMVNKLLFVDVMFIVLKQPHPSMMVPGTLERRDGFDTRNRVPAWRFGHETVCQSHREAAWGEDGDGFHEGHVTLM